MPPVPIYPAARDEAGAVSVVICEGEGDDDDGRSLLKPSTASKNKEVHIAPMLNYSTREFRQLLRILTKRATLWTEMVVDETVQYALNLDEHLAYDGAEHPVICQIGGNSPDLCGKATSIVLERYGYDEINLNIDCPSDRVSDQREFGAILMKKAKLAADILREMQNNNPGNDASKVSVKCRIGVDEWEDLEFISSFIATLRPVCHRFYLHARKCVLGGLMSARQNRSVPPLNYPRVYELCRLFPDCEFYINGGIRTLRDAKLIAYGTKVCLNEDEGGEQALTLCDNNEQQHKVPCELCNAAYGSCTEPPLVAPTNLRGCMMGRAAMDDPCLFHDVDRYFYGETSNPCSTRREVLEQYCQYLERTYPRRCCDNDERTTFEYPPPDVVRECEYCNICAKVYVSPDGICNNDLSAVVVDNKNDNPCPQKATDQSKPKIASRIIARSLKPVQGIFLGIPNSRTFRRVCDDLGQNPRIRNCGPGFVLRKAMQSVSSDVLDQNF